MSIRSVASLVAFLLSWQFSIGALQAQSVVLGYSGSGISTDLRQVIEKERIWAKHGLSVKSVYFTSGGTLAMAMAAGDISVSDSDVPAMINLAVSGILDLKVIAVTINRLEHYFVVQKAIARAEDLKGKRVAVSGIGSASDITTRMVLRFWKLNPEKELTILASGNTPTRIAALTVGHVDAGLVSPDHIARVLATGCCRILADLAELPLDYARFGILVPTSMLRERRETVRNLLRAYIEGTQIFKTRPEVALSVLKDEGIKDPKVAKEVYDRLSKSLREYPVPETKGIQAALDSVPNPKARGAKAEDFIDASLIEEIRKSGFIDRLYGR
jgi:NitT/TauT family transport system substrate-binding protein